MSELNDLLEDIKQGKSIVEDEPPAEKDPTLEDSYASEGVNMSTGKKINFKNLGEEVLEKFDVLYSRVMLGKNTKELTKVDKTIVIEAMAGMVDPVAVAKLTTSPSTINKGLLDSLVSNSEEELDNDISSVVEDMSKSLIGYTDIVREVPELLNNFLEGIRPHLDKNAKVIYNKETLDLIHSNVITISYCDGDEFQYEKYSGDKLTGMYHRLHVLVGNSDKLHYRNEDGSVNDYSIKDIVDKLEVINNSLAKNSSTLLSNIEKLENHSALSSSEKYLLVTETQKLVNEFNSASGVVDGNDGESIPSIILEILEYLD